MTNQARGIILKDLINAINAALGAGLIGYKNTTAYAFLDKAGTAVSTIAALKALVKTTYLHVFVEGYYSSGDGGGGWYWYDSTDTTTADNGGTVIVASDSGRWKLAHNKIVSVRQFGAKGDNVTNDYAALLLAFTAWAAAAGTANQFKLYAPYGTYLIGTSINLRALFAASAYYALDFEMDAGATFKQSIALSPMIYFAPPDGGTFNNCRFKFGQLSGSLLGGTGITLRNISDSNLSFESVSAFKSGANGDAIRADTGAVGGVFNCLIQIGALLTNHIDILAFDSAVFGHGFQGNQVKIGHCGFGDIGVQMVNQSTSNTFEFGALEGHSSSGVLDQAGYNTYRVNFSNDVINLGTTNGRTDVQGYGFTINNSGNSQGRVVDNSIAVTPQAPAIPATGVSYVNLFKRPATVTISGGTVTGILINATSTALTSGSFRVPFGGTVIINYTVVPTWIWTFE